MKFGVMYDFRNPKQWRRPWPQVYASMLDQTAMLDEMGYDNVWLTEHHFVDDGYNPAVLPIAAAIAARTRKIRIGTFVLLLPFHNPVRVAEDSVCVDILSNGRFDLGVGQGYRAEEFAAFQIPRSERSARLAEGVELVQRLWTEDQVTFAGKYNRVEAMSLYPKPVQTPHPPIWIGARTEKAARRVARLGHHLLATIGPDPAIPYRAELNALGRDPDRYSIAQLRVVYVAESADRAWRDIQEHLHYMMGEYAQWLGEANDAPGDKAVWDLGRPEDLRKSPYAEHMMVGTPQECIEKFRAFNRQYVCTHFIMATPLPGMDPAKARRSLELFAREVRPHLDRG